MSMQRETADHVAGIDSRVTGLEVQFRALDGNLRELAVNTKAEFANVTAAINALGSKMESGSKTNWPVLLSAGMLTVAILGSLGVALWSPVKGEIERLSIEAKSLAKEKVDREESSMWAKLRDEQFGRRDERDFDYKRRIEQLEHKVYGF